MHVRIGSSNLVLGNVRDGVGLSTARGAVCEHGGIVSVHDAVEQVLRCCFVDIALGGGLIKDAVEGERLVLDSLPLRPHGRFGEALDGIVFWGVEHPVTTLAFHVNKPQTSDLTSTCRR